MAVPQTAEAPTTWELSLKQFDYGKVGIFKIEKS